MAKNLQKTNALGMELRPETFHKPVVEASPTPHRVVVVEEEKPLTKGVSLTLREDTIARLKKAAKEQDVSASKLAERLISKGLDSIV